LTTDNSRRLKSFLVSEFQKVFSIPS